MSWVGWTLWPRRSVSMAALRAIRRRLQEVGPEGNTLGQAPGRQRPEDVDEGLGDGVGRVVGVGGDRLGHSPGSVGVAAVELVEGAGVTGRRPLRQVGVGRDDDFPCPRDVTNHAGPFGADGETAPSV